MSRVSENIFEKNLKEISGFDDIPEGWEAHLIQDIFDIGRGRVISQNEINEHPGSYPVYSSQSFNYGVMGTIDTFDFEGEYLTWTTDGAYAGTVFHRIGKFSCTNVCGTLKADEKKVFTKFFHYHLGKISKRYVSYVGNPKLMNDIMANIAITVPPLPTQRKISHILSTADAVIEKTQAAIAKYKAIKQGMLHDLFTRGIDIKTSKLRPRYEDAPELYKESKLGFIPKEWEVDILDNVCDVTSSKRIYMDEYIDFGIPFYRSLEIILKSKNQEISTTLYISKEKYESIEKQFGIPKYGDILITSVGTLGISYRVTKDDLFYFKDGNLIWFRDFTDTEYSRFLLYTLDKLIRLQFDKITIGTSQKAFTIDKLKKLNIYVPKENEYKLICKRIEAINKKLQAEQIYLHKLQQIKQGLMGDLLSGKKTVKVQEELVT